MLKKGTNNFPKSKVITREIKRNTEETKVYFKKIKPMEFQIQKQNKESK